MTSDFDFSATYKAKGFSGVAMRAVGWEQRWEPSFSYEIHDDVEIEVEDGGEMVDDVGGRVRVIMVGDDKEHLVDIEDLTMITEDEHCSSCGQIGCSWG